ncbi:MAG: hypothetical protein ACXVNF_02910 [Neobacillus sp.]
MSFFISDAVATAAPAAQQSGIEGMLFPLGIILCFYYFFRNSRLKRTKELAKEPSNNKFSKKEIYIFKDGKNIPAKIEKLFRTYGPYTIEGKRLDLLSKVQLLADSSTTSTIQSGTSTSSAKTGSMVGRAVVGGALAGGTGAVIGGLSGKRDSVINTVSSETLHTELTAELIFEDGGSMYVLLKDIKAFHWLLGFANQPSLTKDELEVEKRRSIAFERNRNSRQLNKAHNEEMVRENKVIVKPIYLFLNWIFGVIFFLSAFVSLFDGSNYLCSLGYFLISFMLLPPIRNFAYSKTNIELPLLVRSITILSLIMVAGSFSKEYTNKQELNSSSKSALMPIEKTEKEAKDNIEAQKKETEEILTKLKSVTSIYENQKLYQKLVTYNPDVNEYKEKLTYYTNKVKEKDAYFKEYFKNAEKKRNESGDTGEYASSTTESPLQSAIKQFGYRCDTVDSVIPFNIKRGYYVFCNSRYKYEVEDVGGRVVVTVK